MAEELPRPKTMLGCPRHLWFHMANDPAAQREIAAGSGFMLRLRTPVGGPWPIATPAPGRTHSWLSRCRAVLIRLTEVPENDLALLHLAFGVVVRRQGVATGPAGTGS